MELMAPRQHRRSGSHLFDSVAITSNVVSVRLTTSMYLSGIGNAIPCGTLNFDTFLKMMTSNEIPRNTPDVVSGFQSILFLLFCRIGIVRFSEVRNLAEVGRMFGLHDLFLPLLTETSAHVSGNSLSCGS